jgi:DNA-binding transcriptional MocR family regulator
VSEKGTTLDRMYDDLRGKGLSLDLTRGKPSPEQLDLSDDLLSLPGGADFRDAKGTDLRNYGGPDGLLELREIFGELLSIPAEQLLAAGNASLTLMHDTIVSALLHGVPGGSGPWRDVPNLAFICPVPGYDRHFSICEALGIRMIPVPFVNERPDLETIARLVASDPGIRGMWAVPTYANPTGVVYTAAEAEALVGMPTAAPDFRLFWDNAYAVHHITDDEPAAIDVLALADSAGNANRPLVFASTSKITYPGAGVAFFGASPENIAWHRRHASVQSIGPDKINQLRHVRLLRDAEGVRAHMRAHRAIVKPRFEAVLRILEQRLSGVATWTTPTGGYFVSLTVPNGAASRAVALAGEIGVAVTPAGASFPYGDDPDDSNIRIAPTFPSLRDLETAIEALCTCVLVAAGQVAAERAK